MSRLLMIALAGVAALAVAAPDQAAAAPVDLERDQRAAAAAVDLENEQRHDVFDDALDEADALLAPDHATMAERAAGLRAEFDLMKEVLEEQKSVIDSLESTAAAEAALARDDPYLAVEPTREVGPEVTDERAGGGVEAAAEAAEAGVTDDALDEAEPLLAPDHAAEAEAEALAADQAVPTLTLKDALVALGVDPAAIPATLEDLVEPEVSDERARRAGGGVEAAAEAAAAREASTLPAKEKKPCAKAGTIRFLDDNEPEVTDDALGPLVAKAARGPAAGEFDALARDVADFARLRTSTSGDVVDFVRWGSQGAREDDDDAAARAQAIFVDPDVDDVAAAVATLRAPDLEYNAWDDEVEKAAQGERYAKAFSNDDDDDDAEKPQIILNPEVMAQMYETNPEEAAKYVFVSKPSGEFSWKTAAQLVAEAAAAPDDDDEDCPLYEGVLTLRCLRRMAAKRATITRLTEDRAARERLPLCDHEPRRCSELAVYYRYHAWDDDATAATRKLVAGFDKETCYAILAAGWCDEAEPGSDCDLCLNKKFTVSGKDVYPLLKAYRQKEESLWSRLWTFVDSFWTDLADDDVWDLGDSVWWQGVFIGFFASCFGSLVGRATKRRKKKRADEAPAPDSLAALARQEGYSDLAEKGMSPYATPRPGGRGAGAVRLAAMPMPSPASVAEQDY